MRHVLRVATLCAIWLSLPTAGRAQEPERLSPDRREALADSLRDFAHQMADLLRDRDGPRVVALYGDTLHFVHVEDGNIIPWSQLSPMMRRHLETTTSNPLTVVGDPGVTIVDLDNAVVYVVHRFEGATDMGPHEGMWSGVLHRFRTGWRIVHSHSSEGGG